MGSFNQIVCAKVIMQLCNNQICLSGKGLGNWFHIHIVLHPKEAIHEKIPKKEKNNTKLDETGYLRSDERENKVKSKTR